MCGENGVEMIKLTWDTATAIAQTIMAIDSDGIVYKDVCIDENGTISLGNYESEHHEKTV